MNMSLGARVIVQIVLFQDIPICPHTKFALISSVFEAISKQPFALKSKVLAICCLVLRETQFLDGHFGCLSFASACINISFCSCRTVGVHNGG